jgi:hypothetical protein
MQQKQQDHRWIINTQETKKLYFISLSNLEILRENPTLPVKTISPRYEDNLVIQNQKNQQIQTQQITKNSSSYEFYTATAYTLVDFIHRDSNIISMDLLYLPKSHTCNLKPFRKLHLQPSFLPSHMWLSFVLFSIPCADPTILSHVRHVSHCVVLHFSLTCGATLLSFSCV